MKSSNTIHSSSVFSGSRLAAVFTALVLASSLAQSYAQTQPPCCPLVAGDKAIQPPDNSTPINILAGPPTVASPSYVIADDFKCTTTGPITDIRIWGSFLNDTISPTTVFTLTFWSDVPNQGGTGFSQPGIVLWSQTFLPGQYNRCNVSNETEVLFLPTWTPFSPQVATNLYYLCFTPDPSKPFVQTGGTAPTNYWLSVSTQPEGTAGQTLFGWKVSSIHYNDTAVYGIGGPPWSPIYNNNNNFSPVDMAFEITTASMPPVCGDTNATEKFFLPPQTAPDQGFDVKDSRNQIVLADDFKCTSAGPITGIQVWGSWLNDMHGSISNFWVGIYSDVPPVPLPGGGILTNSHPGTLLWWTNFPAGQFAEIPYTNAYEYFYDASSNLFLGNDTQVYLYCFKPANPFVQTGSDRNPTNFWLAVRAQLFDTNSAQVIYGWKSSALLYNDPAVWGTVAGGFPSGNWQSITNPFTQQPLNLSMRLTTTNSPPPPRTPCDDTNGVKYIQPPNTQNGYDVWNSSIFPPPVTDGPWILADDFLCTNTGPITNINIWGSWFNDQAAPGTITFWVALYDNVATNSANPFSHPGNLVWSQCFGPGQYTEVPWGMGTESFLDPGPGSGLGPESNIWCYSFPPAVPPTQYGTFTAPMTYWLAVFAQQTATGPQDSFGWKTTYGVQNDISVHAFWNAPFCPTNIAGLSFGWTPTYAFGPLGQQPLDLAFKIATGPSTNCVIAVACPVPDKTNECGTIWFFDQPKITPAPCCTSPPVIQVITTNAANPCAVVYTSVWTVYDCSGATVVAVCTQTVVVVDTTPPAITCPPSQTVECGTAWSFGMPTAYDACAGSNVIITVVGTVTNTGGVIPCNYSVTRTWVATDPCGNSTNCSQTITIQDTTPPVITCPTNQTVECGTAWTFGTPTAIDACSGTNVTITVLNTFTNAGSVIPCNYYVTRTWVAKDQCGNTNTCSQIITIRDTTPPVITCATNKTVVYGSSWGFDPPTAFDACCGTNVTVTVVATFTNGTTCNQTISRVWQALDCCQNPSPFCTQVVNEVCLDCIQTNGIKYVQWPNTNHGFDLWNSSTLPPNQTTNTTWLLADDFVCTNTGFITDIHIWGSWWYDQVTNNAITFWLGIFEDAPTNVNNPFSHPGHMIWSQCFAPGQYAETFWSPGTETFLDPGTANILAPDSQVWYYCFYPNQPPRQEGRPYAHRLYWLAVYASLPPGTPNFFGWKTTTNFQHDISVHAPWKYGLCPAALPPGNLGWTPNHDPSGLPLDLAFQITTATNCSRSLLAIDYFYPTNVVLTWPTVSVLQSSTNVLGPYLDVAGATSPYTNTWPPTQRFYRLRCPHP